MFGDFGIGVFWVPFKGSMCCVFFLHLVDLDIETVALLLRAAPRRR